MQLDESWIFGEDAGDFSLVDHPPTRSELRADLMPLATIRAFACLSVKAWSKMLHEGVGLHEDRQPVALPAGKFGTDDKAQVVR